MGESNNTRAALRRALFVSAATAAMLAPALSVAQDGLKPTPAVLASTQTLTTALAQPIDLVLDAGPAPAAPTPSDEPQGAGGDLTDPTGPMATARDDAPRAAQIASDTYRAPPTSPAPTLAVAAPAAWPGPIAQVSAQAATRDGGAQNAASFGAPAYSVQPSPPAAPFTSSAAQQPAPPPPPRGEPPPARAASDDSTEIQTAGPPPGFEAAPGADAPTRLAQASPSPRPAPPQPPANPPPAAPGNLPQPARATPDEITDIPTGVPAGFEADASIATDFDVYFQGNDVGVFPGRLAGGTFRFDNPQAVAAALGGKLKATDTLRLLAQNLNSNEARRCLDGRRDNCGFLPAGESGVIVNPETFRIDVFLGREFFIEAPNAPTVLPNPVSGPSLIQNVLFTASDDLMQRGEAHLGATFNTAASWGRTAVLSQIAGDDITGFELQQGFIEHVESGWMGSAGLLTTQNETTLTSFRFYGADLSSYQTSTIYNANQGTPISVVLPRHARVELYANGTLVSAREYDGGLQQLDTGALPTGSYTVRIVARDGDTVLLDLTRPFTKAPGLPPPKKWMFDLSVGERVADFFSSPTGSTLTPTGTNSVNFLPQPTGEFVARAQLAHRVGGASALTGAVTLVNGSAYPELSFQTFKGPFTALLAGSADTHGDYSVLATSAVLLKQVSVSFSGRYTDADHADAATAAAAAAGKDVYQPYSQTGYDLFSTVTMPLLKGTLSLTASYDHIVTNPATPDTFTYGLEYDHPIKTTVFGTDGLFSLYADWSDDQKLIGVKFTFFRSIGPHTGLSYDVGAEYVHGSDPTEVKTGAAPVVDVELENTSTIGRVDLDTMLSGSSDSQQHSAELQAQAASPWGTAQLTTSYQDNLVGGNSAPLTLNVQTGFAMGGGQIKAGFATPGEAMVIGVIDKPPTTMAPNPTLPTGQATISGAGGANLAAGTSVAAQNVAAGSYRIVLDSQPFSLLDVGQKVAVPVQPYRDYSVSLQAVGAPPYDFDMTPRNVPVYPGNVIVLHWSAKHVATIYGRLVDSAGQALGAARVDVGTDTTVTDAQGYFVVTGPIDASLAARTAAGQTCKAVPLGNLRGAVVAKVLMKVGDVRCDLR